MDFSGLQSHGPGSSLYAHLREVAGAAEDVRERIVCVCHDVPKATEAWQEYSRGGFRGESPHRHASVGGLLAAALLRTAFPDSSIEWPLIAFHTAAAHHSHLGMVDLQAVARDVRAVASSEQARLFFVSPAEGAVPGLLPEVPPDCFSRAWEALREALSFRTSRFWRTFARQTAALDGAARVRCFLRSRILLARLCQYDWWSAERQENGLDAQAAGPSIEEVLESLGPNPQFRARAPRTFPAPRTRLQELRTRLQEEFVQAAATTPSRFYFLVAPTGLGKTEAMLRAAERLAAESGNRLTSIVYAVPQTSIGDQIFADYLQDAHAQIWSHIRRDSAPGPSLITGASDLAEDANTAFEASLDILHHPFASSYNVTTFNQVLFALCHPLRTLCCRTLGLRNAVIIMDEFHKLPPTVLRVFFRLAWEYAEFAHCRFIFGSATPLPKSSVLGTDRGVRFPADTDPTVYRDPAVNRRRIYRKIGELTIEEVADRIAAFHADSDSSLLVVLNLVGAGTWRLRRLFDVPYDPWADLERLTESGDGRAIVFLDGLVPPLVRRRLIARCKRVMQSRPLTLISTQMIEVGVDLDFDHALIDYQGTASILQRGGRVGREGGGRSGEVEVFALRLGEYGQTSWERLREIRARIDPRHQLHAFEEDRRAENRLDRLELRAFRRWPEDEVRTDADFMDLLLRNLERAYGKRDQGDVLRRFFADLGGEHPDWGLNFLNAQFLAELYPESDQQPDALLLESREAFDRLAVLLERARRRPTPETIAQLRRLAADRRISTFVAEALESPALTPAGVLAELGGIRCFFRTGTVNVW